jgi:hypothetical protein
MVKIKRVSYSYNSLLDEPYFLDVIVSEDSEMKIDIHKTFKTKEEFDQEVEEVVNILQSTTNELVEEEV